MLSEKTERLFSKISNWGFALGLTRARWDLDQHELVISNSHLRIWWEKIQLFLVFLYEAFLCWQSIKSVANTESTVSSLANVPVFYLTSLWILMNCNLLGNFYGREYARLFNGAHNFARKIATRRGKVHTLHLF